MAGRRTIESNEDARGVSGRAATTGRVDGEIQEERRHPSNCWCVPVCWVWSDSKEESEGGRCLGPEGSDLTAEEGFEEGGPNAEEGHEEVWDEVQEALSTMGHEDYDETVLCARSQASRPSSSTSSRTSVRS